MCRAFITNWLCASFISLMCLKLCWSSSNVFHWWVTDCRPVSCLDYTTKDLVQFYHFEPWKKCTHCIKIPTRFIFPSMYSCWLLVVQAIPSQVADNQRLWAGTQGNLNFYSHDVKNISFGTTPPIVIPCFWSLLKSFGPVEHQCSCLIMIFFFFFVVRLIVYQQIYFNNYTEVFLLHLKLFGTVCMMERSTSKSLYEWEWNSSVPDVMLFLR